MSIETFEKLLLKFRLIDKSNESIPTLLEISGYPHYENVCSNILSFYFDTNNAHNFKDLFFKSILECIDQNYHLKQTEPINTINVYREYPALDSKRIDLVIETYDYVIAIENKIYHWLHNDLKLYQQTIDKDFKDKHKIHIVLSLKQESVHAGFISITYKDFFTILKKNVGDYLTTANTKYSLYLFDFIKSIENLTSMENINKDMFQFLIKNETYVNNLIQEKNNIDKELFKKCATLLSLITTENSHFIKKWMYEKNVLVFDFKIDNSDIALDIIIHKTEIICDIFDRKAKMTYETLDQLDLIKNLQLEKNHRGYEVFRENINFFEIDNTIFLEKVHNILEQIKIKSEVIDYQSN